MIPDYFQLWFLYKNDLHNSTTGKQEKLSELNTFKASRLPLKTGLCHFWVEGHLK